MNRMLSVLASVLTLVCLFPEPLSARTDKGRDTENAGKAVIAISVDCLRLEADYESPMETQELMGTVVDVLARDGYWVKVRSPQPYEAWCTDKTLVFLDGASLAEYNSAPKYICLARNALVYSEPSLKARPLCDLVMGDVLRQALVRGKPVKAKKFLKVLLPDGREGFVPAKELMDMDKWKSSVNGSAEDIVALAESFLGTPYLWGGMSPKGFDCSGLVRFCYMMNGIDLPRNASQQIQLGSAAPLDRLKPGDLIFFGRRTLTGKEKVTHVGMYIGDGRFIHSSHFVRINSLSSTDADVYEGMSRLLRARRLLHQDDCNK